MSTYVYTLNDVPYNACYYRNRPVLSVVPFPLQTLLSLTKMMDYISAPHMCYNTDKKTNGFLIICSEPLQVIKTNEELDKLIKHKNIINYIKVQRLSWFGHVQRMPDTRTVKKIFKWKPPIKRSHGRPKYRWEDNIKQDICQMKIKNWIACVQDRRKWKDVVEKAKTFSH